MESSEEDPLTLQFSLRYHPGCDADLQLIHIDRRLDAASKPRKGQSKSVRVVFFAETCLDVNAYAAKLVHEMAFLCDEVPKLIPHLAQTLLQRIDSFLQFQILLEKRGAAVGGDHLSHLPWLSEPGYNSRPASPEASGRGGACTGVPCRASRSLNTHSRRCVSNRTSAHPQSQPARRRRRAVRLDVELAGTPPFQADSSSEAESPRPSGPAVSTLGSYPSYSTASLLGRERREMAMIISIRSKLARGASKTSAPFCRTHRPTLV